ncbi:MAG: hypothetical protein QG599_781 [Pseudomonadota bacterium]|nr:hypothetical protein [Pseudomonadota bacterium]
MTTFKDFSIGAKLGLGFGSVLLLLIVVSGGAYQGLGTAQDGFSEYRRMARNSLLISELEADSLTLRLAVKDYLLREDAERRQGVSEYLGHVDKAVAEARANIKNPEHAALVEQIDQQVKGYRIAFDQVVELTEQRQAVIASMSEQGVAAVQAVGDLIAATSGDTTTLLKAANLRAQILTGRLYAARYLSTGQHEDFERAMQEMQKTDQVEAQLHSAIRNQDSSLQAIMNRFTQAHDLYMSSLQDLERTTKARKTLENGVLNPAGTAIAQNSLTLRESIRTSQNELGPKVQSSNAATVQFTLGLSVVALLLGALVAWALTRMITRPLREAIDVAHRIAQGDLVANIAVNSRDEIGQLLGAMQAMNSELRRIVGEVKTASAAVSSAASEVAQGSADLAQRTEEQASALEETASSMEELTATVQQNADNAVQASQLAQSARQQVEQGSMAVQSTISAMEGIHTSSQKIADIIEVIDGIAFQTNLLALNAAVEAARAGEDGRGFAVVAGEVRKLAQSSADAARQIKDLIESSVEQVEEGRRLADASGETLQSILLGVKKVNDLIGEIAVASREQASGIQQVSTAVLQMDQVTQQNAALVEQTSAASQAMGEQAGHLHTLMDFFQLDSDSSADGFLAHAARVKATSEELAAPMARRATNRRLPTRPTRTARPESRRFNEDAAETTTGLRPVAAGNNGQGWEAF